jgi:hypothetical protein
MLLNREEISDELSRLIALKGEFYKKIDPTPEQVQEFELSGRRIRRLFARIGSTSGMNRSLLPNRACTQ